VVIIIVKFSVLQVGLINHIYLNRLKTSYGDWWNGSDLRYKDNVERKNILDQDPCYKLVEGGLEYYVIFLVYRDIINGWGKMESKRFHNIGSLSLSLSLSRACPLLSGSCLMMLHQFKIYTK